MLAVTDTTPLNYLAWIGKIDLLPKIFERVLVPTAVIRELLDQGAPEATRRWAAHPPSWAEIVEPDPALLLEPEWKGLGDGERAALAVAASRQPAFLLIDEHMARTLGQKRGYPVTGTLGVLDQAARSNLVSFAEAMAMLRRTSFRYPRRLVEQLLAEHARLQVDHPTTR